MAIKTKRYVELSVQGEVGVEAFMEYHDDDYRVINDDGDPDDFLVVRWYGTNYFTLPLIIEVQKGNGQSWQTVTIPAGDSFSVNAGGSVKYEFDVPRWAYRWDE